MVISVHEADVLVFVEVKDHAHHVLHLAHLVNGVSMWGPESPQDAKHVSLEHPLGAHTLHLDGDHVLLTSDETPSSDDLLVLSRHVGESNAESSLWVTTGLLDQLIGSVLEERDHLLVDLLQVVEHVSGLGLDQVLWLRHTDSL